MESLLNDLYPNSGMGGDGVHLRFLKVLRSDFSIHLFIIFNSSLVTGSLATQWLSSISVSLLKKFSISYPLNYSPFSLTSVTCKVLERSIARHLTSFLNCYK